MPGDAFLFLAATRIQTETTTYTEWFSVDMYEELIVFAELSDQGDYTDETINITVQVAAIDGGAYDIASFDEIDNQTVAIVAEGYYRVSEPISWFGTKMRMKVVTAGTSVDYTLKLQGNVKRT